MRKTRDTKSKTRSQSDIPALSPRDFLNPPGEFRPMPFWGLNDLLEDRELRRQIREMKRQGWGGFFMHPRYGMVTPYLTREFMDRVRTCLDEARRQGLHTWIYDEHPFPAGCSGGLVGAGTVDYRHKCLVMRTHHRLTPIAEGVGYFGVTHENGIPNNIRKIKDPKRDRGGERTFLHFYVWTNPVQPSSTTGITDDFIHGFPYTDTLNPKAVREFIKLTYEGYRQAVGKEFGKTLKGSFADVPVYQWHYGTPRPSIPWTNGFEKYFRNHAGYDLLSHLPSLFFDFGDYNRIRHDYWQLINQRFLECYSKQVHEWCDCHNLLYTAHYWGEETLHWQIPWTGDVMTHFEYQHVVAIDHILRNIEDPVGVKQAASVAEQLGKPRTIAETYALCGHNLTYEERKWIGDWEYALGINMLVPYIPAYSFRGRRKRDEPPSQFFQQPYWEHEFRLSDYYGRLSYVLSRGKQAVDVLVLQPLSSAWTLYKPGLSGPAACRPHPDAFEAVGVDLYQFSQSFLELCQLLLSSHRDFHLGNETIMAKHAHVENGEFHVGEMAYRIVVVPASRTWFGSTIKLLQDFAVQGGHIVVEEPVPTMMDGRPAKPPIIPKSAVVAGSHGEVVSALNRLVAPDVEIQGGEDIYYQHRSCDGDDVYFLANTSIEKSYPSTRVLIRGKGHVELWDVLSGRRFEVPVEQEADALTLSLDFAPVSSYLLVRRQHRESGLEVWRRPPKSFSEPVVLDNKWNLRLLDPNALTLDYCEVRIGDSPWSDRIPVWKAHQRIREAGLGAKFSLRFPFEVDERPSSVSLVIEDPSRYCVRLNGKDFKVKPTGSWFDPSLKLFDVARLLRTGLNEVELSGQCGLDSEIENCYLRGDFALAGERVFRLTKKKDTVNGRNLTREGYPFFIGRAVLSQEFKMPAKAGRVYLELDNLDAIIAEVRLNGQVAGHLAWKPYLLDVTEQVRPAHNRLEIELSTSVHNLLGPHHDKRGEARFFVLQHSWSDVVNWTDDYFFVPVGVVGAKLRFAKT